MAHTLIGEVVSTKMDKTAVVSIESKMRHPIYKKVIVRHKKFKAHYEDMQIMDGDRVQIVETRPISKHVHYKIVKKLD